MLTARTKPRSTMFTPRSGSMTSASAFRTVRAASDGGSSVATEGAAAGAAADAGGAATGASDRGGASAGDTGWAAAGETGWAAAGGVLVACRPAGCRVIWTRQVGLWIQSATP